MRCMECTPDSPPAKMTAERRTDFAGNPSCFYVPGLVRTGVRAATLLSKPASKVGPSPRFPAVHLLFKTEKPRHGYRPKIFRVPRVDAKAEQPHALTRTPTRTHTKASTHTFSTHTLSEEPDKTNKKNQIVSFRSCHPTAPQWICPAHFIKAFGSSAKHSPQQTGRALAREQASEVDTQG